MASVAGGFVSRIRGGQPLPRYGSARCSPAIRPTAVSPASASFPAKKRANCFADSEATASKRAIPAR